MRGDAVSRANSHKMVSGKCQLPERFLRRAAALAFIAVFMLACGSQVFADDAAKAVGDQLIADTAPGIETYIVQPGDTLYSISKRYHTSPRVLRSLNSLVGFRCADTWAEAACASAERQFGAVIYGEAGRYALSHRSPIRRVCGRIALAQRHR